ncbi:MAG TPA: VPLPA-CTERM sorting domain-containing protein [Nitrospiraceae bacterium]
MTFRNTILFPLAILPILLFNDVEQASSAIVTYGIEGQLTDVFGPSGLAVGDRFTGTFSYSLDQTGTNVPTPGITNYVFDSYSLTIQCQTVSAMGGGIQVGNLSGFDYFQLNVDPLGTVVTGSINGFPAGLLFLALNDLTGSAFTDSTLPTTLDLANFTGLRRVDVFFPPANGTAFGEITNLSVVPVPAALWLFVSGLGGLALFRVGMRKKLPLLK